MNFGQSIDAYLTDMRISGRIRSDRTELDYYRTLSLHADDVGNRDPRTIGREDCKRTLARWPNPNSQRKNRSILVSFYRWAMEEGIRKDNPAEQTRRPRKVPTKVYRMTQRESADFLRAANTTREKRVAYLGVCAGLRLAEIRGLQRRHFERPGFVWVSADIAKGQRERWVPIIPELRPIVVEILRTVGPDDFVVCAQRWRNPPVNTLHRDYSTAPASPQAVYYLVKRLGERAGIKAAIHPHLMRHAFGDHVARHAGLKVAQYAMGHASSGTTEGYTGKPTLDELTKALGTFGYGTEHEPLFSPYETHATIPLSEATGIEPVEGADNDPEPDSDGMVIVATPVDRFLGRVKN